MDKKVNSKRLAHWLTWILLPLELINVCIELVSKVVNYGRSVREF